MSSKHLQFSVTVFGLFLSNTKGSTAALYFTQHKGTIQLQSAPYQPIYTYMLLYFKWSELISFDLSNGQGAFACKTVSYSMIVVVY